MRERERNGTENNYKRNKNNEKRKRQQKISKLKEQVDKFKQLGSKIDSGGERTHDVQEKNTKRSEHFIVTKRFKK